jgi:hypothetical protein
MRHLIDVVVVERLVAGKLQDFATQLGHFGKLVGGAGGVARAPEVDCVDADGVQPLRERRLIEAAAARAVDAHGQKQRADVGQERRAHRRQDAVERRQAREDAAATRHHRLGVGASNDGVDPAL